MDMEWLWIAAAAAAGLVFGGSAGIYLGNRAASTAWQAANESLRRILSHDQSRELSTFRRELANNLVRRDPDRFLRLYNKARVAEAEIEQATEAANQTQLAAIADKYPCISDFDFVGTLEHVLYADSLRNHDIDAIENHYLKLVQFHALKRNVSDDWLAIHPATSGQVESHLYTYVRQIEDTKFRQRIEAAKLEFYGFRGNRRLDKVGSNDPLYETNRLAVYSVNRTAESRYGFHFKDTNEFAIYSLDGYFYRSNLLFKDEVLLDCLRIDEPI
jgi:hypothetical protein